MNSIVTRTILLSIIIPTYNRCDFLKECLKSVEKEIQKIPKPETIELIISDNASTDSTKEMLKNNFPNITYFCNERNVGVEENVDRCFKYAQGKYTYILSDDDILLPGSLKRIMEVIENEPNYIYINAINFYKKFTSIPDCKSPRLKIPGNIITKNKEYFFELVNIQITLLSTSIYRTSIAKKVNRNLYKGEFIASAQTVLECLKEDGTYIAFKEPCIAARSGTTGGYNLFTVWVKGYKRLILQLGKETGIKEKILKRVYKKTMLKDVLKLILAFRTTETGLGLENRHYIFQGVKEFPILWLPLIAATYLPSKCLMFLREIYMECKHK